MPITDDACQNNYDSNEYIYWIEYEIIAVQQNPEASAQLTEYTELAKTESELAKQSLENPTASPPPYFKGPQYTGGPCEWRSVDVISSCNNTRDCALGAQEQYYIALAYAYNPQIVLNCYYNAMSYYFAASQIYSVDMKFFYTECGAYYYNSYNWFVAAAAYAQFEAEKSVENDPYYIAFKDESEKNYTYTIYNYSVNPPVPYHYCIWISPSTDASLYLSQPAFTYASIAGSYYTDSGYYALLSYDYAVQTGIWLNNIYNIIENY